MTFIQIVIGVAVAAALAILLARQYQRERTMRADQGRILFEQIVGLFDQPAIQRGTTAGVWTLTGRYSSHPFQIKTIADTLATRKLPSLWLMVTLPEAQPVSATTDMMMRAAGVSSFSNFDFLPHSLALPVGFPEQAVIHSDANVTSDITSLMGRHLSLFHHGRGKEFLVSPKGLRIVVQLAEGDRARYGVFREASFEGTSVPPALVIDIMNTLDCSQKRHSQTMPQRKSPHTPSCRIHDPRRRPCLVGASPARVDVRILHGHPRLDQHQDHAGYRKLRRPSHRRGFHLGHVGD